MWGKGRVDSAADSLRGENSKSFAVTIFLSVLPVIFAKMTVARTVLVTVSCKNVGINEMIPFLSHAYRAPREFPEISRWPVRSAHTKFNDACKRCTKRAVINDECLDTILGTSRIDAFNVMSGNGRGVPII